MIYAAKSAGRAFAVIDGTPTTQYDLVTVGSSSISRDGKHVAYVASADKGKTRMLVVDGETKPLPGDFWGWWAANVLEFLAIRDKTLYRVKRTL